MIPAMTIQDNGLYTENFGNEIWWTTDSLKYKGNNVFVRTSQLNAQEILQIATGTYNWSNAVSQTNGLLKFASINTLMGNSNAIVFLP